MKHFTFFLFLMMSFNLPAADSCKNLKSCAEWASGRTGAKYDLGKFEKRSLNLEKDFSFSEGDADFIFNFILQSNDLLRLKRDNGNYQVIAMREMKEFQFPTVKAEEIPASLDYYSTEFALSNKEKVKNAQIIIKKFLSKNGKVLEVADSPKLQVIDMGINLNAVKLIIAELNK